MLPGGLQQDRNVRLLQGGHGVLLLGVDQQVEQLAAIQRALQRALERAVARPGIVVLIGLVADQHLELGDAQAHEGVARPVVQRAPA
ncbi:hypothetical protein D3C81_1909640 [compost metagenome]